MAMIYKAPPTAQGQWVSAYDYRNEQDCEKEDPYSLAVREYKKYKSAAKDTLKDVQLSVATRLQCFAY